MTQPVSGRPLLRMLAVARPVRRELALGALAGAATIGCGVGLLAVSGWLIARASEHPDESTLAVAVVAVRAFGLGRGMLRYAERLSTHDAALRALADLRAHVWRRLALVVPAGLDGRRSGDLLARFVTDVGSVQDLLVRAVTPPVVAGLTGVATVAGIALLSWPAAVVLVAGLLVAGAVVPTVAARASSATARAAAEDRGELATRVTELLDGRADLVAFRAADREMVAISLTGQRLLGHARRWSWATGLGIGLTSWASGLTLTGLLVVVVRERATGTISDVAAAVVVLTGLAAFEAVTPLAGAAQQITASRAAARRVLVVTDAPAAIHEPSVARALPDAPVHLQLVGVRVSYSPGADPALDGVDLDLRPGTRTALVGPSGAGKSTVAAVLLRLRDVDGGRVLLNGHPLTEYRSEDVRRVVSGCLADAWVFDSTIRENLLLARPAATQGELDDAAHRVRLLDWISRQPLGWETRVGAHGDALSGGERQRLALARALLADPQVLVLDEPTAHLDPLTRDEVLHDLLLATAGRTTLLITHDSTGLDAMDAVVRLDGGRVVGAAAHGCVLVADVVGTTVAVRSGVGVAESVEVAVVRGVGTADVRLGAGAEGVGEDGDTDAEVEAETVGAADDRETAGVEDGATGVVITAMRAAGAVGAGRTSR